MGRFCQLPFWISAAKVNFDSAEQGLLGLAFHPSYSSNKRFYLNYDRLSGGQIQTVIAEYQARRGSQRWRTQPANGFY